MIILSFFLRGGTSPFPPWRPKNDLLPTGNRYSVGLRDGAVGLAGGALRPAHERYFSRPLTCTQVTRIPGFRVSRPLPPHRLFGSQRLVRGRSSRLRPSPGRTLQPARTFSPRRLPPVRRKGTRPPGHLRADSLAMAVKPTGQIRAIPAATRRPYVSPGPAQRSPGQRHHPVRKPQRGEIPSRNAATLCQPRASAAQPWVAATTGIRSPNAARYEPQRGDPMSAQGQRAQPWGSAATESGSPNAARYEPQRGDPMSAQGQRSAALGSAHHPVRSRNAAKYEPQRGDLCQPRASAAQPWGKRPPPNPQPQRGEIPAATRRPYVSPGPAHAALGDGHHPSPKPQRGEYQPQRGDPMSAQGQRSAALG